MFTFTGKIWKWEVSLLPHRCFCSCKVVLTSGKSSLSTVIVKIWSSEAFQNWIKTKSAFWKTIAADDVGEKRLARYPIIFLGETHEFRYATIQQRLGTEGQLFWENAEPSNKAARSSLFVSWSGSLCSPSLEQNVCSSSFKLGLIFSFVNIIIHSRGSFQT